MAAKFNAFTIVLFILLAAYFMTAVSPNRGDTYWHLAIGRRVWQEKAIPKTDTFTYGSPDTHFTSTEWLAGLIFYTTVKYFGPSSLAFLRTIIALTTIYLLYLTLQLTTKNQLARLLGTATVGFILAIRLNDRPEMFSFLAISFVNYCCFYFYHKKKLNLALYILPVAFLFWPNLSPFVPLGLYILICWSIIFVIGRNFKNGFSSSKAFLLVVFLSILTAIVQYDKIFFSLHAFSPIVSEILEWSSLPKRLFTSQGFEFFYQIPVEIYFYFGYLALFATGLIVLIRKNVNRFPRPEGRGSLIFAQNSPRQTWLVESDSTLHLRHEFRSFFAQNKPLLFIALFYLVLLLSPTRFYRLIPITILVTTPALFLITKSSFYQHFDQLQKLIKILLVINTAIICISIVSKDIFAQKITAFVITSQLPDSSKPKIVGVVNKSWKSQDPDIFPQIIKDHLQTKRIFAPDSMDDFFIWNLPSAQTFSDIMYQYRTKEDFKRQKILEAGTDNWQDLLREYDIDTVAIYQDLPYIYRKAPPVFNLSNWQLIYVNEIAMLYARDDVIKSIPLDLSAVQPELTADLKFKPENEKVAVDQLQKLMQYDEKNAFARNQLIKYYQEKDLNRARQLAEESRKLLLKDPTFSVDLAIIYAKLNNCQSAADFAKEAIRKSFNHIIIKGQLNQSLANCNLFFK